MYIVAIAWMYVVFMMSITEATPVAGVMTFLLYGVFPLSIVLYLMGTPQRKRNRQKRENSEREAAAASAPVSGSAGTSLAPAQPAPQTPLENSSNAAE